MAPRGIEAVETLMSYIWSVTRADQGEILEAAGRISESVESPMGITYDRMIEKGRMEGRVEGRVEVLAGLMEEKFGPVDDSTRDRLGEASIEDLDRWVRRILKANTLADVFED